MNEQTHAVLTRDDCRYFLKRLDNLPNRPNYINSQLEIFNTISEMELNKFISELETTTDLGDRQLRKICSIWEKSSRVWWRSWEHDGFYNLHYQLEKFRNELQRVLSHHDIFQLSVNMNVIRISDLFQQEENSDPGSRFGDYRNELSNLKNQISEDIFKPWWEFW